MIASALDAPDHLRNLDSTQIRTGILLEFINAAAVVGIGVMLFPTLRKYSEGMALGYSGSRIIESTLLLVSALSVLVLLPSDETNLLTDATTASRSQALGSVWYDLAFQLAMTALGAGSLLLCYILYKASLVPRALSILGFVGYIALFTSAWLELFGRSAGLVLFLPGSLFEILFPLWLIARGFNEPAVITRSLNADVRYGNLA